MNSSSTNTTVAAKTNLTIEDQIFIINFKVIVFGWFILIVSIIGILLNSFTIIVLMHPKMRSFSTNAYLTALSGANIICLLSYIFLYSLRFLVSYDYFKQSIYKQANTLPYVPLYESFINYNYRFFSPTFTTFQLYAIYLTCAVTVDRWIYLTWPLKADKICTTKNTLCTIIGTFLFCVIYNLPKWFEVKSARMTNKLTNQTYYQAHASEFSKKFIVKVVIGKYGYLLFVYGIPFLVLLLVNIGIIIKLIETKKRKSHLLGNKPLNNKNNKKKNNSAAASIKDETMMTTASTSISKSTKSNNNQQQQQQQPLLEAAAIQNGTSNNSNNNNNNNNNSPNFKLKKSDSTMRTSMSTAITSSIDPKITLMIMAVVLAFFCCQFPYCIVNMLQDTAAGTKWFHITKTICDFLASLNCCINFLIYCLFGRNFRQIAKTILMNPTKNPYTNNQQQYQHQHANSSKTASATKRSQVTKYSQIPSGSSNRLLSTELSPLSQPQQKQQNQQQEQHHQQRRNVEVETEATAAIKLIDDTE